MTEGGTRISIRNSGTELVSSTTVALLTTLASGNESSAPYSASATVPNVAHFYTIHLSLSSDGSSFAEAWYDPDPNSLGVGSQPTGGSYSLITGLSAFSFNILRFEKVSPDNGSSDLVHFDELRLGTTWSSVSPTVSAVPEPSTTAAVFGSVGLLLAWIVRKRMRFAPSPAR